MASIPRKISVHDQLVSLLREGILGARWEKVLPAESELCREFQVSRMTLRKALAQLAVEKWIIPGGRGRHHRVRRRPVKQDLPSTRTVRILTPFKSSSFGATELSLYETLSEYLGASGYRMVQESHPRLYASFSPLKLAQLDALADTAAWVLLYATEKMQRWFAARQRPVVIGGRAYDQVSIPSVYPDSVALARHAVGLLGSKGHRELVYLIANVTSLGDRMASETFVAEARRAGLRANVVNYDETPDAAARMIRSLIATRPRPTGFVVGASEVVITLLCHLQAAGIRVPGDASIIGTWDHDHFDYTYPTIARYRTDGRIIGRQLGRIVLDLIRNGPGKIRSIPVMPEYVSGGSVAPLRA